jgi:uncharacterized membrane protein YgdD (TMEM256/DUF423 family)
MDRMWVGLGAVAGLLAVALAAMAAHVPGLGSQAVRDAVQMQGWHALALFGVGIWARRGGVLAHLAGAAFALGMLLFCGSIVLLALTGVRLPSVAPAGGMLLMAGWALLGLSALRAR